NSNYLASRHIRSEWTASHTLLLHSPMRQKLLPLTRRRDLILTVCPEKTNQGDSMDKPLTWFLKMWGAFVDIWWEHRRFTLPWRPDRSMHEALKKMIEATNKLKDPPLLNHAAAKNSRR